MIQKKLKYPGMTMKRINIDNKKNEINISLNTKFYNYNSIMIASNDFIENCWIYIDKKNEDHIMINLKPKSKNINFEELGLEFYNYVLGLMQNADNK